MKISRLSLSTVSALVTAAMLLLSLGIIFFGIMWVQSLYEQKYLSQISDNARLAYDMLDRGELPKEADFLALVQQLTPLYEDGEAELYLLVLKFGLGAALICSLIGFWLARKVSSPLEKLTRVVNNLREGDFSVRVPEAFKGTSEVVMLVERFNALAEELENMERRLRFNTMAVAHELRTPLTIVQGVLQGMADKIFPRDDDRIEDLLMQVEGLTRLVNDLRTLSLAASQKLVTERCNTDIALAAEQVLQASRSLLAEAGMVLETNLKRAIIPADNQRLRQAMLAVLENACRYAASGKYLRCESGYLNKEEAFLRIIDRGPGFEQEFSGYTIDVFWRGEPSRARATGGSGLGLSIVHAIVTAHGGRVEQTSLAEGGACVTMIFPRKLAENKSDGAAG
ncbi:ATP-binding protein [Ochrobactrum sp. SFR4]|uniref:ATP-binding protein n=1 Tax=Ochrobactrum sp. SFR4 TaxID=2717368 RepID=UPI001C8C6A24|nr:ATP-binding protein [Ochrobactrum sp. SFR4]MBX8824207.1 HAMP domain-containing protein [Ochrobactrum sp. SFR4]